LHKNLFKIALKIKSHYWIAIDDYKIEHFLNDYD